MEFSLNVFTEISHYSKRAQTCHQDATTAQAKHVRDRIFRSAIHASVIHQIPWFVLVLLKFCKILVSARFCGVCARQHTPEFAEFTEFKVLLPLGKTPLSPNYNFIWTFFADTLD